MSELDTLMDQMIREYARRPEALAVPQVGNEYLMTLVSCGDHTAVVAKNQDSTWRIYDPRTNDQHEGSIELWIDAMDVARRWVRKRQYLAGIVALSRDFDPPAVL